MDAGSPGYLIPFNISDVRFVADSSALTPSLSIHAEFAVEQPSLGKSVFMGFLKTNKSHCRR